MKLRDVPAGQVFTYLNQSPDRYFKLHSCKFLKPLETTPSLTELASKFGEGLILYCNPESEVILCA